VIAQHQIVTQNAPVKVLVPPRDVEAVWLCHLLRPFSYRHMWITNLNQRPMPYEGPWLLNDLKYNQEVEQTELLMDKATYQADLSIPSPTFLVNDLQWIKNFKSETKSLEIDPKKFTEGLKKYKEWWIKSQGRIKETEPIHLTTHVDDEITCYTDLIWHAHLTDHVAYARDCARLFGKIFGHLPDGDDDKDNDSESKFVV